MISAEQQKRINELCQLIEVEKDDSKITELARELNSLLEAKAGTGNPPVTSPKNP
jgi:hypothetical protein